MKAMVEGVGLWWKNTVSEQEVTLEEFSSLVEV